MSTRTELPWDKIQADVISAVDACNEQRPFVSVSNVAEHIHKNQQDYPAVTDNIRNMTKIRTIKARVSMSFNKLKWPQYSRHSSPSGNSVFVDPRYRV